MTGHEGNELYCTLNHLQVYGKSMHSSLKGALKEVNKNTEVGSSLEKRVTTPLHQQASKKQESECQSIWRDFKGYINSQNIIQVDLPLEFHHVPYYPKVDKMALSASPMEPGLSQLPAHSLEIKNL